MGHTYSREGAYEFPAALTDSNEPLRSLWPVGLVRLRAFLNQHIDCKLHILFMLKRHSHHDP